MEVDLEKEIDECRHHTAPVTGKRISVGATEGESIPWSFIKVKV